MIQRWSLLAVLAVLGAHALDENIQKTPSSVRECYENEYLLERDNRLPHTMDTLVAMIRKIENAEVFNMDLRTFAVSLLHRFRMDGVAQNPNVPKQDGVTPYAPMGFQYYRFAQIQRFVPGNAVLFPNNSITDVERCTLHFMLSSSFDIIERGDEGTVCRFANGAYRRARSIDGKSLNVSGSINDDVETLSPEQIELITANRDGTAESTYDPNSLYPELPPNHPDLARLYSPMPESKCPVENGVLKTRWGMVSGGPVLAGIAAALQPQVVGFEDLLRDGLQEKSYSLYSSTLAGNTLDNKWMATLAGDLAEVALRQGPKRKKITIGVSGDSNSTTMPRWYFLNSNENLEFTSAEVRGDLDGLILANELGNLYARLPNLRLSQILDMYYSGRGLSNSTIRACNRRVLFTAVSPNSTMTAQAFSAAFVLSETRLAAATIDEPRIEEFVVQAARALTLYVPTMNKDLTCEDTDRFNDRTQLSVDLTIILDTNWPFESIQIILAHLLQNIEISQFNSNFTLLNGNNGDVMINSTNSILDFYSYNSSHYKNITHGFDLSKSIQVLKSLRADKLNTERSKGIGGGQSDVVLIIPHTSTVREGDKDYCLDQLRRMREEMPDTNVLFMTYGSKDRWSSLVQNAATDLFSVGTGSSSESLAPVDSLVTRIKQVPKRLINSQCGADYVSIGSSNSYVDYVLPSEVNYYKLHPNYFFNPDSSQNAIIKIQGSGWGSLTVCSSREALHVNKTAADANAACATITNNVHDVRVSCADATYIHECPPLYLSVSGNATENSYQCTDPRTCRFPHQIKYTVSYENLVCVSSATSITSSLAILLLLVFSL